MLAILSLAPQLSGTLVSGCSSVETLSLVRVASLAATIGLMYSAKLSSSATLCGSLAWISRSILTICKLIAPRSPTCPGTVAATGFGAATKALFCPQSLAGTTGGGGRPTCAAMFPASGTG
jgi:hypothetical protein